MRDGDAVVDDGYLLRLRLPHPSLHLRFVQHAPAAVDDQPEAGEVLREGAAGSEFEFRFRTAELPDPAGHLYGSDIAALTVVRAAFADQHPVAGL